MAGDLAIQKDSFTTASGRQVALHIYAQDKNIGRVDYAMQALKAAMKWDEDTFGEQAPPLTPPSPDIYEATKESCLPLSLLPHSLALASIDGVKSRCSCRTRKRD